MISKELGELLDYDLTDTQKGMIKVLNEHRMMVNSYFLAGDRKRAKAIAAKGLSKARKFHLTDAVIDFARMCRHYYSAVETSSRNYEKYDKVCQEYIEIRRVEEMIDTRFSYFYLTLNKKKVSQDISEVFIEEVEILVERKKNFFICLRAYVILVNYHSMMGNHAKAISFCQQATEFFKNIGFQAKRSIESFSLISLPMLIQTERFEEALSIINEYIRERNPIITINSSNAKASFTSDLASTTKHTTFS